MDLFREVVYTLLGLMMNLCLQQPLVSEVLVAFFSPFGTWGQPRHTLSRGPFADFTKRTEAHGLRRWRWEWGKLGSRSSSAEGAGEALGPHQETD